VPKVLVTGATGALGSRLTKRLVEEGYPTRALLRERSNLDALKGLGVEIVLGDMGDERSIAAAVRGVDIVVHAAAGTSGTARDSEIATIQGTRSILKACSTSRVRKLVYISSCNVYELAGCADGQIVTEEAQLERSPLRRGHYSAAKLQAETLVTEAMNRGGCPAVVLRLGTLYGRGAEVYTPMMGVSFSRRIFVVFGDGESELPLTHVDNAVDAILDCMACSAAENQVFNVVDPERITKKMYIEQVVRPLYPNAIVMYCPMSLLLALTWLQEKALAILGKPPILTVYRLLSSQKRIRYSASKIEKTTGWRSRIRFQQGAEEIRQAIAAVQPSRSR
jgi:2-alkyl-3-oxoalkanoate reductase